MIEEIKISLMETVSPNSGDKDVSLEEYIVRGSAKFRPKEYWEKYYRDSSEDEEESSELFESFLSSSLDLIYNDLVKNIKAPVDSVGIWTNTGKEVLEIAMSLESLNDIQKYGEDDIIPVFELYKMSILKDSKDITK